MAHEGTGAAPNLDTESKGGDQLQKREGNRLTYLWEGGQPWGIALQLGKAQAKGYR